MSEVIKTKPEVESRCRGRHLEKWIWRHNSVVDGPKKEKITGVKYEADADYVGRPNEAMALD